MTNRLLGIIVGVLVLIGRLTVAAPSDEVSFKTAAKAPFGFDSWTFFWKMPEIDADASISHVVIQPDGKEHYVGKWIKAGRLPAGTNCRSDHAQRHDGADPAVLYNQDIVVKFMVDKGTISKGWMWSPDAQLTSASQLHWRYSSVKSLGRPFMVNVGPDRTGRIPGDQLAVLGEFTTLKNHGEEISSGTAEKSDVSGRMIKLKSLFDQGLINQDEYDRKKKEIIDAL